MNIIRLLKNKVRLNLVHYQCVLAAVSVLGTYSLNSSAESNILLSLGTGPQPDSSQKNSLLAVDYEFWQLDISSRRRLSIGVSYTGIRTNANRNSSLEAISIYPQLTLFPVSEHFEDYYFFVRALGPTYISKNSLGDRNQSKNLTFQAQVGVGRELSLENGRSLLMQISWKHFSNANIFSDNDGIDIPVTFTLGYQF